MRPETIKKSLESTLRSYLQSPRGREILSSMDEQKLIALAKTIKVENTFGDIKVLEKTLTGVWKQGAVQAFLFHCLWCAHREALWAEGKANPLLFRVKGMEHLSGTQQRSTIVISPMTLSTEDAMQAVLIGFKENLPERPIICYGEDMEAYIQKNPEQKLLFADDSLSGIRKIIGVLNSGGLFLTYPDFVYNNHNSIAGKLFGIPRAFSAGLIKIAAHTQAQLLPAISTRKENSIEINFFKPVSLQNAANNFFPSPQLQEQVLTVVISRILESLILQVPNQWRLLPTLTYESMDMA